MPFTYQEAYPDPIDEKLFPYHHNLVDAVTLFVDAPLPCKLRYGELIKEALPDLNQAKEKIEKKKSRKKK